MKESKELFLDANAHLPLSTRAQTAYSEFLKTPAAHGHPSSPSYPGRQAATALEVARLKIADLIGAKKPGQIIFTAGCTSACKWGLEMFMGIEKDLPVYCSPVEHPAVRDAIDNSFEDTLYLEIDKNGTIEVDTQCGKFVCVHMQNETGVIQPLENIKNRKYFDAKDSKKYLFSDMSQSLGKIPINVTQLDVDVAVFGAHKFGGPGNFGFIYLKDTNIWQSFDTGSRYFLDRAGTPDVAGAVATAAALEEAIDTLIDRIDRMSEFQEIIEKRLESLGFEIIGRDADRSVNTTFVSMPGKGLLTMMKLGDYGIHVGLGSACGSLHAGPSPLIKALGREGNVHDFMRISQFGEYGEKEAKYFLNILEKVL